MLGYKYRMTSHRRLLAVIGDYGWSKTFGNEILCMLTVHDNSLFSERQAADVRRLPVSNVYLGSDETERQDKKPCVQGFVPKALISEL